MSGMYSFSSGCSLPKQCMKTRLISFGPLFRMKRLIRMPAMSGGRGTAISGSRPTMSVSVWWRVWLQRQGVGSRSTMKQAIW